MGWITRLLGLSGAVRDVAEVFVENRTEAGRRADAVRTATLAQHGAEFAQPARGWFDHLIDGLNRLPRPCLALGTLALFGYAMADPIGFAARMQGLALVPDPLWWLLGAIVSFYFGARELHHFRKRPAPAPGEVAAVAEQIRAVERLRDPDPAPPLALPALSVAAPSALQGEPNAALAEWRAQHKG